LKGSPLHENEPGDVLEHVEKRKADVRKAYKTVIQKMSENSDSIVEEVSTILEQHFSPGFVSCEIQDIAHFMERPECEEWLPESLISKYKNEALKFGVSKLSEMYSVSGNGICVVSKQTNENRNLVDDGF
jgi:hypothetical protein